VTRNTGRNGSRRDDQMAVGYWNEREAAQERAAYEEAMAYKPHNADTEAALLGALMIDNRLVEMIGTRLKPEHFFEAAHGRIFERIVSLVAKNKTVTPITLAPYFDGEPIQFYDDQAESFDPNGYRKYLGQLASVGGAGMLGARGFADQIVELAMLRELVSLAQRIGEAAKHTDTEIDPMKVVQVAETELTEIASAFAVDAASTSASLAKAWDETFEEIEDIAAGKPAIGITIDGYTDWNDVVGRMEPADLIYLGGRPSMGKTGVACAVALGAAEAGHATELLSLESPRKIIARRIMANRIYEQGVTSGYSALSDGKLTSADRAAIAAGREAIASIPLNIDDPSGMNVEEVTGFIRRRQRAWSKKGKELKLVVIDYLGRFGTAKRIDNPSERVSYVSNRLKQAAKDTGVAMIVLVQLSRAVEQREDKHPVLSDLLMSGSLEADADTVVFVYRDEYYLQRDQPKPDDKKYDDWRQDLTASRDRLEIYSTKRREGALTKRNGYFFSNEQAVRASGFYRADLFAAQNDALGGDGLGPM
jgi:replicative DNA helicase